MLKAPLQQQGIEWVETPPLVPSDQHHQLRHQSSAAPASPPHPTPIASSTNGLEANNDTSSQGMEDMDTPAVRYLLARLELLGTATPLPAEDLGCTSASTQGREIGISEASAGSALVESVADGSGDSGGGSGRLSMAVRNDPDMADPVLWLRAVREALATDIEVSATKSVSPLILSIALVIKPAHSFISICLASLTLAGAASPTARRNCSHAAKTGAGCTAGKRGRS